MMNYRSLDKKRRKNHEKEIVSRTSDGSVDRVIDSMWRWYSRRHTGKERDTLKIGLVTDVGGGENQSFNQSEWEGVKKAKEEHGVEINYLAFYTDSDYVPNIETFIDEEYDLIFCVSYMLAEATREASENYSDQQFAIVDDTSCADLDKSVL